MSSYTQQLYQGAHFQTPDNAVGGAEEIPQGQPGASWALGAKSSFNFDFWYLDPAASLPQLTHRCAHICSLTRARTPWLKQKHNRMEFNGSIFHCLHV